MNDFIELTSSEHDIDFKVLLRKSCIVSVVQIVNGGAVVNMSLSENKEFVSYFKVKEDVAAIRALIMV